MDANQTSDYASGSAGNESFDLNNNTAREWNSTATVAVILSLLTFLSNGFVLAIFVKDQRLRTPFTIYLMNLLCANLILNMINPLRTLDITYLPGLGGAGSPLCQIQKYSDWTSAAVVLHSHVLITINRIWAIAFPVSYRNHHSKTAAIFMCVTAFVYAHFMTVPFQIIDAVHQGLPAGIDHCVINPHEQVIYSKFLQIIAYDFPVFLIVAAYPLLYWERNKRSKMIDSRSSTRISAIARTKGSSSNPVDSSDLPAPNPRSSSDTTPSKEHRRAFSVLTVLTASIFICWTPSKIYGTLEIFANIQDLPVLFSHIAKFLYGVQAILDPILFAASLKNLRDAIKRHLRCLLRWR